MIPKQYWKLWKHSRIGIVLLSLFALLGLFLIENFRVRKEQPHYTKKLQASRLAYKAFEAIKPELTQKRKIESRELDPAGTGLIGDFLTPITSNSGSLSAKQTSINPNLAAIFVQFFEKAEIKEGDTVAVAISGSFPAANICLYAAMETLKLKPIVIASASSSQYGANVPGFLWLDIESLLIEKRIFKTKTRFASLGGIQDQAIGISEEGKRMLREGILRNQVVLLEAPAFKDSIQLRLKTFRETAGEKPIKVFVNIGGGTTIFGTSIGKQVFKNGILTELPEEIDAPDSVIKEFLILGIPVINIIQIESLARRFGLPIAPKVTPKPGDGKMFIQEEYNPWIIIFFLASILFGLYRITNNRRNRLEADPFLMETIRGKV